MDFDLPEDVELYAGFVFHSAPHRHKPGKFYVSLEEYPFHLWPPYVTAGAYVLSRAALIGIHGASFTNFIDIVQPRLLIPCRLLLRVVFRQEVPLRRRVHGHPGKENGHRAVQLGGVLLREKADGGGGGLSICGRIPRVRQPAGVGGCVEQPKDGGQRLM